MKYVIILMGNRIVVTTDAVCLSNTSSWFLLTLLTDMPALQARWWFLFFPF